MPPDETAAPDSSIRTLILMRHGETVWNRDRRVMGDADVPLSPDGRRQCDRAASVLAGFGIDRVVTSPLARAIESARIIADAIGARVESDADLQEVRFGRWQGQTYDEIVDDPEYHAFAADPVGTPTPGGETILDVQRRGLVGLERMAPGECVLFVSHGDIIRSTICHYLAVPVAEFRRIRIDNCGLTAVCERDGSFEVKFVNMLADPERSWEALHWAR